MKAWDFAALAHEGQLYRRAVEGEAVGYMNHVGSVAIEVVWVLGVSEGFDGDLAVQCALLHDVVEDTSVTLAEVAVQFGQAVADGVGALTKNVALPTKRAQMMDSLARIRRQPREVWLVKMADRIVNLSRPPFHWTQEKGRAYQTEARLIYDELHSANVLLAERLLMRIETYADYVAE